MREQVASRGEALAKVETQMRTQELVLVPFKHEED